MRVCKGNYIHKLIIKITRAELVAKQRVGIPLMSRVKLVVPVKRKVLKPITSITKTIRKNRIILGTTYQNPNNFMYDLIKTFPVSWTCKQQNPNVITYDLTIFFGTS